MITKLRLHNWKSFADACLYIDPMTFIIGTNACGKSNVLDAMGFLKQMATGRQLRDVIASIRGGADWIIRDGYSGFSLSVTVSEGKDIDYEYEIGVVRTVTGFVIEKEQLKRTRRTTGQTKLLFYTDTERDNVDSPTIPILFYTGKRGRAKKLNLSRITSVLSQVEIISVLRDVKEAAASVRRYLSNIFILNPIPENMRGYSRLDDKLKSDASNIAGVLAVLEESQKIELEAKLTKYLRPLPEKDLRRVWVEKVGLFNGDAMLYCEEKWTDDSTLRLDARGMSDGTLRFIAIIVALLTGHPQSLLIIEEVDNGLHPSRSVELVRVLRELGSERSIDILCTTHNPALMDALGHKMMPFISYVKRDPESGTSMIALLEDKDNLAKLMAGHTIGDMMTNDLI